LYGLGDTYHLENSHVIPALLMKIHEAKVSEKSSVEIWGTGKPRREFLYVDDLADALVYLFQHYSDLKHVNIGAGYDVSIKELAEIICNVVGYNGVLDFNTSRPDGVMQKLMDSSKITQMGWAPKTSFEEGLGLSYSDYLERVYKRAA
ncbi:MAG: NAD-dependent epimerase/dehydratase family protein, partial [Bdellovibrionales bacterium]